MKQTQHLSTSGVKLPLHFAALSFEHVTLLTLLKQSCFFNCKLMTVQTLFNPGLQLKNDYL